MRPEPLGQARAFRQFENARIINNAGTDIAALERNDPAPPAVAHEMIGRPVTTGSAGIRVIAEFFPPLVAVPIFYAGESGPDGIDGMFEVRLEMAKLARK